MKRGFPRHGYLDRATFDLTFHHAKKLRHPSVGKRLSEEPDPEVKDLLVTKISNTAAVSFVTFALPPFERHNADGEMDKAGAAIQYVGV